MLSKPVVTLNSESGIFILNLMSFSSGPAAALDRIPQSQSGVYAWYRAFDYPDAPEAFYSALLEDVAQKKFADRTAPVLPHYTVTVASHAAFSENKKESLRIALQSDSFRKELRQALSYGILFQTPLYIGKAKNVRKRISQHLDPDSPLRARLQSIGIDIKKCSLLIIPTDSAPGVDDSAETATEALYEEVFSRLFNPHFSIRYG